MIEWKKPAKIEGGGHGSYQMSEGGGYCVTFQRTSTGDYGFVASRHSRDFARMYVPSEATREDLGMAAQAMRVLCESYDNMETKV